MTRFAPVIDRLHWMRLPCMLRSGSVGHVVVLRVEKSDKVHTVIGDGTWMRMDASNREMNAVEIADLSYRRGTRSAAAETVPVSLDLLATQTWYRFAASRGLKTGSFPEQLQCVGLAELTGSEMRPTRAAVLLFADEPGSLLAVTNRALMEPPYRGLMEPAEGVVFRVSDGVIFSCFSGF